MKHHFGDMLDRDGDYWTIIPNRDRYSYVSENLVANSPEITIVTIGKNDNNWDVILSLPNLEELTLHEPSKDQIASITSLTQIKRLRITHYRPKDIEFLSSLVNVEELVLEYVSGFSDLSPIRSLSKLKSLHLENLRRVSNFDGLSGINSLRYLRIDGTIDWKQPIENFQFIEGLPNLEVLSFGQVITKCPYPAFLPIARLRNLKKIKMTWQMFDAKEYALLSEGLKDVEGADFGPFTAFSYSWIQLPKDDIRYHLPDDIIRENHPEVSIHYDGSRHIDNPKDLWFEFTGKKAGRVKSTSLKANEKCAEYTEIYNSYREEARKILGE